MYSTARMRAQSTRTRKCHSKSAITQIFIYLKRSTLRTRSSPNMRTWMRNCPNITGHASEFDLAAFQATMQLLLFNGRKVGRLRVHRFDLRDDLAVGFRCVAGFDPIGVVLKAIPAFLGDGAAFV